MALTPFLLLFRVRDPDLPTLGFLAAMDRSVVMRSRTVCQKGMGRCLPSNHLPLPRLFHLPDPHVCLGDLLSPDVILFVMGAE